MELEIFFRYLHFLAIITMASTIVAEHLLLKTEMTRAEIRRLSTIDGIYGLSAILVVAAGLTLWFGVGKPAAFYNQNWVFHTKLTLVIAMGLLSIYPTVFFMRERKGEQDEKIELPKSVVMLVRMELLLLVLIPLLATIMAKGIGFFGD